MRARRDWQWIGALSFIAAILASRSASAGEGGQLVRIAPRPEDSDRIALGYVYGGGGLLYSRDRGETFSALCREVIRELDVDGGVLTINNLERVLVTGDGHVLAPDLRGLWIDDGNLCNWKRMPELKDEWVRDIVLDPRDANVVYGVLSSSQSDDNGLFRRNADGSIDRIGARTPNRIWTLRVIERPEGGLRFYMTVIAGVRLLVDQDAQMVLPDGGFGPRVHEQPLWALRYSDDEGETWTEHAIEIEPGHDAAIEAIDPTNVARVVIRLGDSDAMDTLVFAEDGGARQAPWFDVLELSGVVIEPSGTVWIAGQDMMGAAKDHEGVWRAKQLGAAPVRVRQEPAYCIALHEGELELCDSMDYGIADKATAKLGSPLLFNTVDRVHSCEGVDVAQTCRQFFCTGRCAHWPQAPMCTETYGVVTGHGCGSGSTVVPPVASSDAGASDAGVAAEASGCNCGVLASGAEQGTRAWLVALALAASLAARRRRRCGRPCPGAGS
jgi:hypothetical protein